MNPKKPTMALLALVFLLAAMPPAPAAQFTPFEAAVAAFDAEVAAGVAADAGGCVSIAVFIGDELVWAKGYGWADIENRIAATPSPSGCWRAIRRA